MIQNYQCVLRSNTTCAVLADNGDCQTGASGFVIIQGAAFWNISLDSGGGGGGSGGLSANDFFKYYFETNGAAGTNNAVAALNVFGGQALAAGANGGSGVILGGSFTYWQKNANCMIQYIPEICFACNTGFTLYLGKCVL